MNMIGHHREGVQVVLPEFGIAEFEAATDTIRHASILQPQRPYFGTIELLVDSRKFLPRFHVFFDAKYPADGS